MKAIKLRFGKLGIENPIKASPLDNGRWIAWFGDNPTVGVSSLGDTITQAILNLENEEALYRYLDGICYSVTCSECGTENEHRELLPSGDKKGNWGIYCVECGHLNILGYCHDDFEEGEDEDDTINEVV